MRDSYRCLVSSHPGTVIPGSDKLMLLLLLLHRCRNCIFRLKMISIESLKNSNRNVGTDINLGFAHVFIDVFILFV